MAVRQRQRIYESWQFDRGSKTNVLQHRTPLGEWESRTIICNNVPERTSNDKTCRPTDQNMGQSNTTCSLFEK